MNYRIRTDILLQWLLFFLGWALHCHRYCPGPQRWCVSDNVSLFCSWMWDEQLYLLTLFLDLFPLLPLTCNHVSQRKDAFPVLLWMLNMVHILWAELAFIFQMSLGQGYYHYSSGCGSGRRAAHPLIGRPVPSCGCVWMVAPCMVALATNVRICECGMRHCAI